MSENVEAPEVRRLREAKDNHAALDPATTSTDQYRQALLEIVAAENGLTEAQQKDHIKGGPAGFKFAGTHLMEEWEGPVTRSFKLGDGTASVENLSVENLEILIGILIWLKERYEWRPGMKYSGRMDRGE